jgi:dihydropteroate synthase
VLPVVRALHRKKPSIPISIDTTKPDVAEAAVRAGASIINDVSGLRFDPRIAEVARRYNTGLILMHSRHTPRTMQQMPFARSVWRSIRNGLKRSVERALGAGVKRSQLILDPGLGFGKSREQNFEIIGQLERLQSFRLPIIVGTSRKSFVRGVGGRHGVPLQMADAAAVVACILGGAHIVRVHDVAAMLPAIRMADEVLKNSH